MKIALRKSKASNAKKITYFGDGQWDKKACNLLNYSFVLIGDRFEHVPKLENFDLKHPALSSLLNQ